MEKFISLFALVGLFVLTSSANATQGRYHREVTSALDFISAYQSDGRGRYDEGQWIARVTSYVPSVVGVGKMGVPFDEPSAFVAASIANVLAEIYFLDPTYREIPPMVEKAAAGFTKYRWGDLFNFYPPKTYKGKKVRGPRYMYLARQWQGFANIPPDADTTSVSYTTLHYLKALEHNAEPQSFQAQIPSDTVEAFSEFRDLKRVPHVYNATQGHVNTGAFMTWLFDEKNPRMPRNIFANPGKGTRIPFNYNDVDCVVNANVLKLLTYARKTEGRGYKASCSHLNRVVRLKQYYFCGMYYPSYYALPYTIASLIESGADCLNSSKDRLLHYLLSKQKPDGSWRNSFVARPDYVQSTAWALNALMVLGDKKNPSHQRRVARAVKFLLRNSYKDDKGRLFWSGQVFYAATFIARYPVVWRSSAYTTAVVAKALVHADSW
ncbi:Prenyltransferase and squalene oxidase repeat protein [compost metagenome]